MAKIDMLLIFCFGLVTSYAQPIITNDIFPVAGDLLFTARDSATPGAIISAPSGAAQNWDFSFFVPNAVDTVFVLDAASGSSFTDFPESEIRMPLFGGEGYLISSGDSLELLGFLGDPGFGVAFLVVPTVTSTLIKTPMNFGDIFQDDFSFNQAIDPADFPELDAILPAFPPIDSIRAFYTSNREDTIDAWGSLATYLGDFNVLRRKSMDYTNLLIEFKSFGFWVDPATVGINLPFGGLDTIETYDFWSASIKEPIASVNVNNSGNITSINYKADPDLITGIIPIPERSIEFDLFPNPANRLVTLNLKYFSEDIFLEIYSASGALVLKEIISSNSFDGHQLNVEYLPVGVYHFAVYNLAGKILGSRKLAKF